MLSRIMRHSKTEATIAMANIAHGNTALLRVRGVTPWLFAFIISLVPGGRVGTKVIMQQVEKAGLLRPFRSRELLR